MHNLYPLKGIRAHGGLRALMIFVHRKFACCYGREGFEEWRTVDEDEPVRGRERCELLQEKVWTYTCGEVIVHLPVVPRR